MWQILQNLVARVEGKQENTASMLDKRYLVQTNFRLPVC